MRHKVFGFKLGRTTSHRRSLLRNMATSLIVEERIETTIPKAKALKPIVEKMITLGKRGDLAARRQATSYLMTAEAVTKLFDTVGPRFGDRAGGYTRIIRAGLAEGRRGGQGVHRAARQRAGAGRKAPEARRCPRQESGRNQEADGRSRSGAGQRSRRASGVQRRKRVAVRALQSSAGILPALFVFWTDDKYRWRRLYDPSVKTLTRRIR